MRKSNRIRGAPKGAKDFVSSFEGLSVPVDKSSDAGKTAVDNTVNDDSESPCEVSPNLTELRKENDNLIGVLERQSEKIRRLEGKEDVASAFNPIPLGEVDNLVEELVETKHKNVSLRLEMDVMAEKILKQQEEIDALQGKVNVECVVAKEKLVDTSYEEEFPNLGGNGTHWEGNTGKVWANVVAQNRNKEADVRLNFVKPIEENGVKVVEVSEADVVEECQRWNKAVVVYVLGSKIPFNVMNAFLKRK